MNTFQNYNEEERLIDIFPEILKMENFNGWDNFFSHIYQIFERDFVTTRPLFRGKTIGFKRYPEYDEKSATFWHIISEGDNEAERTPCIKRCERVNWARPMIENNQHKDLLIWVENKKGENRLHIFFEEGRYIVVLNKRKNSWLFWTAFYIEENHQIRKYNKRFERNKNIEIVL